MITIKNPIQIQKMRDAGKILYEALQETVSRVKPGVTTKFLSEFAESIILKHGATPNFKGYGGFPETLCTSVNCQVVHGIPSDKTVLKDGDIISLDGGCIVDGWHSDSAITVGVGNISDEAKKLIKTTEECFFTGIRKAVAGVRLGDVGNAIQTVAEREGYGVVRDLTGHGIGKNLHEEPSIFNFGKPGHGQRLIKGMTLAIEPMINLGDYKVEMLNDGWTIVTKDRLISSHYEHTILIKDGLPELLTYPGFEWKEDA